MQQTIISKFSLAFWIRWMLLACFVIFPILTVWYSILLTWSADDIRQILEALTITIVPICIIWIFAVKRVIRITVSPNGLFIKHLLVNRVVCIQYDEITHISNSITKYNPNALYQTKYIQLRIELDSGKHVSISEIDFTNYDELKEQIRKFRFHLL